MRRIIINEHLSLDGVIQGPGGPEEDTSGGFDLGGWSARYSDDISGKSIAETIQEPYDLLLGRLTFEIWETYWPRQSGAIAERFNSIKKFVASNTRSHSDWDGTIFLEDNVIEQIEMLKNSDGPDLHLWGSADFAQTLFQNGLVDQLNLWIYPVVLGKGKKLFRDGLVPGNFKLTRNAVSSLGVFIASYEADGEVRLGQIGDE